MHFGKERWGDDGYVYIDLEPDDNEFVNDIPECCIACGGEYPNCVDSCAIFEED